MDHPNTSGPTADGSDPRRGGISGEQPTLDHSRRSVVLEHLSKPGDRVGPYTLLEIIGEGGFGTVWLAERREPMVQRVALKIIKPGMDSKAVVARFEQERQALAVMDHPNVAKVFDGGVTEKGLPYFVMEYVAGRPITGFCDEYRFTIRQRLELFTSVCDAVQHAHMKGIIHRDLKPSNVLAEMVDGKPLVKVIDFGIAKAMDTSEVQNSVFSMEGQLIGTPEYMSPEQAGGAADIDTRTDVYSLGVMLYELLVGRLPFDPAALRQRGMDEIRRIVREEEPPRPSTRLGTLGAATGAIAQTRHHSPSSLVRELRRELEWIPLKAMRKERVRRYESAAAFGEDIRRYLDGRALVAAPESRAYLARKFVRRNRVLVFSSAAVFVALAAGLAGTMWQAREAARQRDAALAAQRAERERADQLNQVSRFQGRMLNQIDFYAVGVELMKDLRERYGAALEEQAVPDAERAGRVERLQSELASVNATDVAATMIERAILKPSLESINKQFKAQPLVDAQLRHSLAALYALAGLYEDAEPLLLAALETRRRLLGVDHPDTLESMRELGTLYNDTDRPAEGEKVLREVLERCRKVLGPDHADTAYALAHLGHSMLTMGRLREAEAIQREALVAIPKAIGAEHPDAIGVLGNLAITLVQQGKFAEAEPFALEALNRTRVALGDAHIDTLQQINNMGLLYFQQGRYDDAERFYIEALEKRRRVLGEDHPDTLQSLNNMGALLRGKNMPKEAEPYLRQALEKQRRVLGESHHETLLSTLNLGTVVQMQGRNQEALELLLPIETRLRQAFQGANAPRVAVLLATVGRARVGLGFDAERFALAEGNFREAYEIIVTARGVGHKDTLAWAERLVDLYTAWDKAEPGRGLDAKAAEWKAKGNAR